jgi:citryl-CoA lyase
MNVDKKQKRILWTSRITEVAANALSTHGIDQREIIRHFSYEEMVFFLLRGRKPSVAERELLRAVLVSHISHGITGQSTLAVRMAADCRSSFLHALIAGFSTGAGIYHQGGLQATMLELQRLAKFQTRELEDHIAERLRGRDRIMGFGHRFHKQSEPRAQLLMEIAAELQFSGPHIEVARRVECILQKLKPLPMNIEAAGGAILLDLGFDPTVGHLIIILGRSPMFAAAYLERLAEKRAPFQKIEVADIIDE